MDPYTGNRDFKVEMLEKHVEELERQRAELTDVLSKTNKTLVTLGCVQILQAIILLLQAMRWLVC